MHLLLTVRLPPGDAVAWIVGGAILFALGLVLTYGQRR